MVPLSSVTVGFEVVFVIDTRKWNLNDPKCFVFLSTAPFFQNITRSTLMFPVICLFETVLAF